MNMNINYGNHQQNHQPVQNLVYVTEDINIEELVDWLQCRDNIKVNGRKLTQRMAVMMASFVSLERKEIGKDSFTVYDAGEVMKDVYGFDNGITPKALLDTVMILVEAGLVERVPSIGRYNHFKVSHKGVSGGRLNAATVRAIHEQQHLRLTESLYQQGQQVEAVVKFGR